MKLIRLCLPVLLLVLAAHVIAEPTEPPLLIYANGDYFLWDAASGDITRLTDSGLAYGATVSPDGGLIAYIEYAPIAQDYITEHGREAGGGWPTDIWLLDPISDSATRIASQPDTAIFAKTVQDNAIARGSLSWSPDGTRLAWSELIWHEDLDEFTDRILIYDPQTERARLLRDDFPTMYGVINPMVFTWGQAGIMILRTGPENDNFLIYDTDGSFQREIVAAADMRFTDFRLIEDVGREYIAVAQADGTWQQVDPATGDILPMYGAPAAVSHSRPAESVQMTLMQTMDGTGWQAVTPAGAAIDLSADRFTIAPDGTAIAYLPDYDRDTALSDRTGRLWRVGSAAEQVIPVPTDLTDTAQLRQSYTWGPLHWFVQPPPVDLTACTSSLSPRLLVGEQAYVLPGDPNHLRSAPDARRASLDLIPGGAALPVLAGPVCDGVFNW